MGVEEHFRGIDFKEDLVLAAMGATAFITTTVIYNHQELTHQTLKLKPGPRMVARTIMWGTGVKPRIWADEHEDHHAYPDTNYGPVLEEADFLEWRDAHPERQLAQEVPALFPKGTLDRDADLTPAEIKEIGAADRPLFEGRYTPPADYSDDDIVRLLDISLPRFRYPKKSDKQEAPPRSVQSLFTEMRDPYSPALHEKEIMGVQIHDFGLYKNAAKYHEAHENDPDYKGVPADNLDKRLFDKTPLGISLTYALGMGVKAALKWRRGQMDAKKAVAEGAAVVSGAMAIYVFGSAVINAWGHSGNNPTKGLEVKPDGTYTSNLMTINGFLRFLVRTATDDELNQDAHHKMPWSRVYSAAKGMERLIEAPFTSGVNFMTERGILMEKGDQFGHPEFDGKTAEEIEAMGPDRFRRPDEPTKATVLLQQARARTLEKDKSLKASTQQEQPRKAIRRWPFSEKLKTTRAQKSYSRLSA